MDETENELSLERITAANKCIFETNLIYKTPMLSNIGQIFDLPNNINLHLKLENMQSNGSFKIRGVLNQVEQFNKSSDKTKLVTFSAGNYGKAFSYICSLMKLKGKVLLPETAPESRIKFIQSYGIETEKMPTSKLLDGIEEHKKAGWKCLHPFDDINLIAGYSSIAFEILDVVNPDIVLVCCGGGGLLAGISYGLSALGSNAIVYGVEPETANTMYQSFEKGKPVMFLGAKSIASGLAPPLTGTNTYKYCREYTKGGILLVSDDEIKSTCKLLFEKGIKAEPSGCAGLAALLHKKVPNIPTDTQVKIAVIISGGNVSAEEMFRLF